MRFSKYRAGIMLLSSSMVIVLGLTIMLQNPMDKEYRSMISQLMEQEGIQDERLLLVIYPELEKIRKNNAQIRQLRAEINRKCGGPAPQIGQEQAEAMKNKCAEMKDLIEANRQLWTSLKQKAFKKVP